MFVDKDNSDNMMETEVHAVSNHTYTVLEV